MIANTPIRIGAFTLKNRLTMAPTVKFDYTDDSAVATPQLVDHYAQRAKGGCGLICVEATAVLPGGRFGKIHMGLWNEAQMESHKPLTAACHEAGAVVIIQLNHTGYVSNPECGPAVGPSAIPYEGRQGSYTTVAMTVDEIHEMQQAYVKSAVLAKEAGYDGIQLHGCHGYLINQFVCPRTNLRTDAYGGSPENRARFAAEIISAIREACGPDFLISIRTTGFDGSIENAIDVAECYVAAGCDYLQVSAGLTDLSEAPALTREVKDGDAEKITDLQSMGVRFKHHFNGRVPVSCVGGILSPEDINFLLDNGYTDTVDLARGVLADPRLAKATLEGTNDYVHCFDCPRCQYGPATKHQCPARNKRVRL